MRVSVGGKGDAEYRWRVHRGGGWPLFWPCEQHVDIGLAEFLQVKAQKYLGACSKGVLLDCPIGTLIPITMAGPGIGILKALQVV